MLHVCNWYILCPNCLASTFIVLTWLVDLARCWRRRSLGWRVWQRVRRLEESQSVLRDPGYWSLALYTLPPPAISLLEPHSDARWAVVFWNHITRFAVIFPLPFLSWVSSMPPYPPSCFIGVHVINCWAVSAQPCIIFSTPGIFLLWPRYCLPVRRNSSLLVRKRDWSLNNYFIEKPVVTSLVSEPGWL